MLIGPLELVVFALMTLTFAGFVALGGWLVRRLSGGSETRIRDLEARVRELEEQRRP